MDLTQLRLMGLGAWGILVVLTLGPALALSWLLDLHDRRQSRGLGSVDRQFVSDDVRRLRGPAL